MNVPKLKEVFIRLDNGAAYWQKFQEKFQICSKDIVIIMASKSEKFHYYTLKYLQALKKEKKADRIYILHTKALSSDYILKEATASVNDIVCQLDDIQNLCKLASLYCFSEQIIINTHEGICDYNGCLLIDGIKRKLEDIIAVSLLGLSKVPEVIEKDIDIIESKFKRISWSNIEKQIKLEGKYIKSNTNVNMEDMIRKKLQDLIENQKITKDDNIILFGLTTSSMLVKTMLEGYSITAIIDNDRRKIGKIVDGISVYAPEEYLYQYDASKKIIIASRYYHSMCEQLYQYGYEVNKNVYVVYFKYNFYDALPSTISYYKEKIQNGSKIYSQLVDWEHKQSLFLCPYSGTGDIYLIGLYLKKYITLHQIKSYVIVVCSQTCRKVAELFGFQANVLSNEEMWEIITYTRAIGLNKSNTYILNDSFENNTIITRLRGYKGIDFNTMFAKCVFQMDKQIKPDKIFQKNADLFFEEYHLKKGKTVLLSPYANTMNLLTPKFWEHIAEKLVNIGYSVCTNVASKDEQTIKGTRGIFIPYNMIIDFLNKAGYFIGLRSGLCDIISSTTAKLCILYQQGLMFGAGTLYDYFSLNKMQLRDNSELLELQYDLENMNDIEDIIIKFIKKY